MAIGNIKNENRRRTIFVISIIAGILGAIGSLIYGFFHDNKLSESLLVTLENSFDPQSGSIIGITDTSYKADYLNYLSKPTEYLEFPFEGMRTNLQVYLLKYSIDSNLILVARDGKSRNSAERGYQELWISKEFVLQE
jgi:hypothetical protein